jgi:hypothetical protein
MSFADSVIQTPFSFETIAASNVGEDEYNNESARGILHLKMSEKNPNVPKGDYFFILADKHLHLH